MLRPVDWVLTYGYLAWSDLEMHFPSPPPRISASDAGRVLVVGSVNLDVGYALNRLPLPGETLEVAGRFVAGGGKGANQAMAARRLGADVSLLACVGSDASDALADLDGQGVDLSGLVRQDEVNTGTAVLLSAPDDNCILIDAGANGLLDADRVCAYAQNRPAPRVVVTNNEVPVGAVEATVRSYADGAMVVYNPSPTRDHARDLLEHVDLVVLNGAEAAVLYGFAAGATSAEAVMTALEESAAGDTVVTLGSAGVIVFEDGVSSFVPAFQVEAVDTVGAGDAFLGALAAGLASGRTVRAAAVHAAAAAAITVTAKGARAAPLSPELVDTFIRERATTAGLSGELVTISERRTQE